MRFDFQRVARFAKWDVQGSLNTSEYHRNGWKWTQKQRNSTTQTTQTTQTTRDTHDAISLSLKSALLERQQDQVWIHKRANATKAGHIFGSSFPEPGWKSSITRLSVLAWSMKHILLYIYSTNIGIYIYTNTIEGERVQTKRERERIAVHTVSPSSWVLACEASDMTEKSGWDWTHLDALKCSVNMFATSPWTPSNPFAQQLRQLQKLVARHIQEQQMWKVLTTGVELIPQKREQIGQFTCSDVRKPPQWTKFTYGNKKGWDRDPKQVKETKKATNSLKSPKTLAD